MHYYLLLTQKTPKKEKDKPTSPKKKGVELTLSEMLLQCQQGNVDDLAEYKSKLLSEANCILPQDIRRVTRQILLAVKTHLHKIVQVSLTQS